VIQSGGYAGVALLMGIESACIPLPSEIIMPFAGYVVYQGHMSLIWAQRPGYRLQSWLPGRLLDRSKKAAGRSSSVMADGC